jgi:hypothetical protein
MHPVVRPGSIVLIDTQKRAIAQRKDRNHESDRPIYFLLTRARFVSGFCELDRDSGWLTLIPHQLSPESSRRWRYKTEIKVVGTVAAIFSRRGGLITPRRLALPALPERCRRHRWPVGDVS